MPPTLFAHGGEMRKAGPRGFTLTETLVTLLLMALVVQGGWSVLATFRRGAEKVSMRAQALESVRTLEWVLSEEVGGGEEGLDWMGGSEDSLVVRAYRGLAEVLEWTGEGEVRVCFRGIRNPNLGKDSILTLSGDGSWTPRALLGRTPDQPECPWNAEGRTERWQVEAGTEGWILARIFEKGSYHFYRGALRYRQPGGGRQPLTPENIKRGMFKGSAGKELGVAWVADVAGRSESDSTSWTGVLR